jgi:hypothetical protein
MRPEIPDVVIVLVRAFPVHIIGIPGYVFIGAPVNGMFASNDAVYTPMGIDAELCLLKPGGVLVPPE